jgi:hypothetical protein
MEELKKVIEDSIIRKIIDDTIGIKYTQWEEVVGDIINRYKAEIARNKELGVG